MNVPIGKAKAQLSRYIRNANAGKEVVITSRGKPVARLTPAVDSGEEAKSPSGVELERKLKAAIPGIILGTGRKPLGSRRPIKIRPGEKTMAEIVIEGRGPR